MPTRYGCCTCFGAADATDSDGNDIDEQFMEAGTDWVMKKPTPPNNVIVKKLRSLLVARRKKFESLNATEQTELSSSEAVKIRLGLSICPSLEPPDFKKQKFTN